MRIPVASKNEFVVKVIVGGGCKTATVQRVASTDDKVIKIVDSHQEYDLFSGREIDPAIPGFYSEIIALDGGEAERWNFSANA